MLGRASRKPSRISFPKTVKPEWDDIFDNRQNELDWQKKLREYDKEIYGI